MDREELIDRYIMGRMTAEEKETFERQMNADAELKRDVFMMHNTRSAVRAAAMKQMFAERERNIRRRRTMVTFAGLVAVIVVLSAVIFFMSRNKAIVDAEREEIEVGADQPSTELIATPVVEPSNKKSAESVDPLRNSTTAGHVNPTTEVKAEVEIEETTIEVTQGENNSQMSDMPLWTKAAAAISDQDWTLAKSLLRQVIEADGPHKKQAQELLTEIEENIP